jgi:hypothetical protein
LWSDLILLLYFYLRGTMKEIRKQFEILVRSAKFPIERNEHGEYKFHATYNMWVGYWMAKVESNELTGDDAKWVNANK